MERRSPIGSSVISMIFLIIFLISIIDLFDLPPIISIAILAIVVSAFMYFYYPKRKRFKIPTEWREPPSELGKPPFQPPVKLMVRKWIIVLIAFIAILGFILFENWWLNVNILESMYLNKAYGIDWWNLAFLNNHYFYACIAIGLLIALSDPRIIMEKDASGKRKFYIHSKTWGGINALRRQMYKAMGELPPPTDVEEPFHGDRVPIKRGLIWRLVEFLIGTIVVGPVFAKELAIRHLIIAKWIENQQTSWIDLLNKSLSILYTRIFTSEMPTGTWLIENSPTLDFLTWLRMPLTVFCGIWAARLIVSFILEFLGGRFGKVLRAFTLIGLTILVPSIMQVPMQVFDVTTPFYVRSMVIGAVILIVLSIFLSLKDALVQYTIGRLFRRRIILATVVLLVLAGVLYGPAVVATQYAPAMQGNWIEWVWKPKHLPAVEYTRWATGLEQIKEDRMNTVMDTGENIEILSKIRVLNDDAAKLRLRPYIGEIWMDLREVDIVWSSGREYWIAPLTIVLPASGEETWRASRMLITHSERVLATDASTGEIVSIQSVFNLSKPVSMYYGEGGLFASSDIVYIGIPTFFERHLPDYEGPATYDGELDYTLTGFECLWFFSGLYGREQLRWDFGGGTWGDIKMLYLRDIDKRLSEILLPGMTVDEDPYIVSDGENLYWSLYVYVERDMPTEYLDYPQHKDRFWRLFATVLINVYDGSIHGYLLGLDEENYVLDFYRSMYPQWNKPIPKWLEAQLRYPEYLFEKQIDSYNWYHVSDPLYWQERSKFYGPTTGAMGEPIEDVRYVVFSLNKTISWTSVRLVEKLQSPGKNLAGLYLALNGEDLGEVLLLRGEEAAVIGPQTALDTVNNFGATKALLTLNPNWIHGNILMYVINNNPYYYIPYYAKAGETTLSPAMMVTVDSLSQKVGYYVISNPQDASEVGSAAGKAYSNLVGVQVELTAEARRQAVIDEFEEKGYKLWTPNKLNPAATFQFAYDPYMPTEDSVSYLTDEDWPGTQSAISSFIDTWVKPYDVSTILFWESDEETRSLNFGVMIGQDIGGIAGDKLFYIKINYS